MFYLNNPLVILLLLIRLMLIENSVQRLIGVHVRFGKGIKNPSYSYLTSMLQPFFGYYLAEFTSVFAIYLTSMHQMHQMTSMSCFASVSTVVCDLIKTNILVRQTPLSSRLSSNWHVGRILIDKSLVIHGIHQTKFVLVPRNRTKFRILLVDDS